MRPSKAKGFTLSEVLLVLSVIGVVAALTIPTLIQKVNNAQYVSALKKEYSVISQAYNMLLAEDGGDLSYSLSGGGSSSDDANAMNTFATKLNIIKNCGTGMGCWSDGELKNLNGNIEDAHRDTSINGSYGKAILADGSLILIDQHSGACTNDRGDGPLDNAVCASVYFDVNGFKGPNTRGRDYFFFWITKTGIYPAGSYNDGKSCDVTGSTPSTADGCAAKILTEGAMNY